MQSASSPPGTIEKLPDAGGNAPSHIADMAKKVGNDQLLSEVLIFHDLTKPIRKQRLLGIHLFRPCGELFTRGCS
jgi:hypothetical protein